MKNNQNPDYGNGLQKATKHLQPGAAELLSLADMVRGHARRIENLATWRDVLQRNFDAQAAGEHLGMADLLREIQASRFAGIDNDVGFFIICQMAERHAETIMMTDAGLDGIHSQMETIRQREDADWDLDDPDAPEDYRTLAGHWSRRYVELEQVREARFIAWLSRHGELGMADLYVNDRADFDRRREAGRCEVHGPMPDTITNALQGDTVSSEVVQGNE